MDHLLSKEKEEKSLGALKCFCTVLRDHPRKRHKRAQRSLKTG